MRPPPERTVMSSEIEESDAEAQSVHHLDVEIDPEEPELPFADAVAELKGTRSSDLAPVGSELDDLVRGVLLSPPPEQNQAEISFTYEGFRVTLYHDGHAVLRDVRRDMSDDSS